MIFAAPANVSVLNTDATTSRKLSSAGKPFKLIIPDGRSTPPRRQMRTAVCMPSMSFTTLDCGPGSLMLLNILNGPTAPDCGVMLAFLFMLIKRRVWL